MMPIGRRAIYWLLIPILTIAQQAHSYDAVEIAVTQYGDKYEWSREGPDSFDCSGLTQYAYGHVGIGLPRTAAEQATEGDPITTDITRIGELRRGDLLFFGNNSALATQEIVGHVGIYIADGQMVNAYYDDKVRLDDVTTGIWPNLFISARRLSPPGASTKFAVGDAVEATEDGANIRDQANNWLPKMVNGQVAKTVAGIKGRVASLPIYAYGIDHWFWEVDFESGASGWVAEEFLTGVGASTFLRFTEGDPGGPGDGVFVNATGFNPSPPYPLAGVTNGVTITAFPPASDRGDKFDLHMGNLIDSGPCAASDLFVSGPHGGRVMLNGVEGYFANVSQSLLQNVINVLNQNHPGCNITLNDLFIRTIYPFRPAAPFLIETLDAGAIRPGQNQFVGELIPDVTLFSNFGSGDTYTTNSSWQLGGAADWPYYHDGWGAAFTPAQSASLDTLRVVLNHQGEGSEFDVSVRSDSGNVPGAVLESFHFSNAADVFPGTLLEANSTVRPLLAAGTQYWVVVSVPSSPRVWGGWHQSLSSIGDQGRWAYMINGGSWEAVVWTEGFTRGVFEVLGTPIP